MKTWTNPEIEELEISLTAAKANENKCELHNNGKGHTGPCGPDCEGWEGWDDDGSIVS